MKDVLDRAQRDDLAAFLSEPALLAFDFDGTLAPIVRDPERAGPRARTLALLGRLSSLAPCAVISGRARADVAARLEGLKLAAVIGNHGLERKRGSDRHARRVSRWRRSLRKALAGLQGVVVEDKRLSLALHYRQAPDRQRARRAILAAVADLEGARVFGGKAVVNVLPQEGAHKGRALEQELRRLGLRRAVYVGDDETDEDVFRLPRPGRLLSVRVGRRRGSAAAYYVDSQARVDALLARLVALAGAGAPQVRRARRRAGSLSKKGASTRRAAVARTS